MNRRMGILLTALCLLAFGSPASAQCLAPFVGGVTDFGPAPVGTTMGPEQQVLGYGCSGACAAVMDFITGPNASDFVFVTSCNLPASTMQSCVDRVRFNPTACGPRVAFLVHTVGGCVNDIIPMTGTGTATPVPGPPLTFPSACAGTLGASVTLTLPANTTPSIVGPGNFSITATNCPQPASTCTVTIRFNPLAAACGTVTSTLQLTSTLSGCGVATFELSGFACSFTCAIGLAGTVSLTAAGRKCVLDSLQIAANAPAGSAGQVTRCAALRCAECCAESDLALRPAGSAARASIQALLDQIHCLQACFGCAPFPC